MNRYARVPLLTRAQAIAAGRAFLDGAAEYERTHLERPPIQTGDTITFDGGAKREVAEGNTERPEVRDRRAGAGDETVSESGEAQVLYTMYGHPEIVLSRSLAEARDFAERIDRAEGAEALAVLADDAVAEVRGDDGQWHSGAEAPVLAKRALARAAEAQEAFLARILEARP